MFKQDIRSHSSAPARKAPQRRGMSASLRRLAARPLAAGALLLLGMQPVQAANDAWSTAPTDNTFTGINWTVGATVGGAPTGTILAGDALYFDTSSITTLNENETAGFTIGSLTFNADASAYTIGGNSFALGGNVTNSSANLQTINDAISLTGTRTFTTTAGGGDLTLGGNISGNAGFTAAGAGITTLTGTNTYLGTTTINAGSTLALGGAGTLGGGIVGTFSGNVTLNGAFVDNSMANETISSTISGTGTLTQNGPGTLTITGTNTYSGATTVSGGTLQLGFGGTLGSGTYAANITDNAAFVDTNATTQTLTGVISGTGTLTQSAAGTLTLKGTNTYTGGTTVSAGTLQLAFATAGATNILATGTALTLGGGTFNDTTTATSGANSQTLGNLALSGGGGTVSVTTTAGATNALTFTGVTRNAGGTVDFVAAQTGTSISVGSATSGFLGDYAFFGTGTTETYAGNNNGVVQAATLTAESTPGVNGFQSATTDYAYTSPGSTDTLAGPATADTASFTTGAQTIDLAGNTLTLNGFLNSNGLLTIQNSGGAGGALVGGSNSELVIGGSAPVTISAPIVNGAAASALTDADTGTLTLTGANTYTGGTNLSGGILNVGSAGALGATGTVSFGGGTLQYSAANTTDYSSRFSAAANQAYSVDTNGQNVTLAGTLTSVGGSLTKIGTGTLTLTGASTYAGLTTISGGVLQIGNGTAGNDGSNANTAGIVDNAALVYNQAGNQTDNYGISGTGTLTKTGTGNLTLGGKEGLTGGTTINGGTLTLTLILGGSGSSAALKGPVTVNAGATLALDAVQASGGNALGNNGTLTNDTSVLNVNGGLVNILNTTAQNSVGGGYTSLNLTGGTLSSTGGQVFNIGPALAGAPSITSNASATTSLISANVAIVGTAANTLPINVASGTTASGSDLTISGIISGADAINKTGTGNLTLTGVNTYSGATTITGGTLTLAGAGTFGAGGAYAGAITDNTAFVDNSTATQTLSGVVSGTGTLTQSGTGTLKLTGTNTYTGATTINAGTLQLGNAGTTGALATGSAITDNGTFTINRTNAVAQGTDFSGGAITGTGRLTQAGAGTTTLNAANTYSGGTTVSAGTLALAGAAGSNNATGTGGVTVSGTSNSNVASATEGVLQLGQSNQIADTAAVTLNGGTINTQTNSEAALGTLSLLNTNGAFSFLDYSTGNANGLTGFTGNSQSSTLAFTAGGTFATGSQLDVVNYEYGTTLGSQSASQTDHFFIGTTKNLTTAQLAQITFVNPDGSGNNYSAFQTAAGEIVPTIAPTPEPGGLLPLVLGIAGTGVLIARKRRAKKEQDGEASAQAV